MDDTEPYMKPITTYRAGVAHDPDNEELTEGIRRALQQAMGDSEFNAILSDPVKRQMLVDKCLKK